MEGRTLRLKQDHSAMATYNDNLSGSDHCIACATASRPQLRIDSWMVTLLEDKNEQCFTSFSQQEEDLFHDCLVISGARLRPLNPWAAVGSGALLSLLLLALVVIPLFHTDALPARERLTMLYVPPAGAASNVSRLSTPTSTFRNTPTKMSVPSAVHATQEAPSPPVDTAGGLVGEFLAESSAEFLVEYLAKCCVTGAMRPHLRKLPPRRQREFASPPK